MTDARYVIAGAARPRSTWFNEVSQWSNTGAIPAEFVKCMGLAELRNHVLSGRPLSCLLIDGGLPNLDRDLFAVAAERDIAVIVARDARIPTDWKALGANAVLDANFDRGSLLDALASTSSLVSRAEPKAPHLDSPTTASPIQGHCFAVTGSGGAGTSTVAMALAQGIGRTAQYRANVALADLCLRADQAMLHDTQTVTPGIQELVEKLRDENNRRWRDKVTDVRRWFDFVAAVIDRETLETISVYQDSSGQSGGEKAKLAFTILVAAIAYQYDLDPEHPAPDRFQFVVVDEMFSRVDDQHAEYAMELFRQFGLQLLIVAPLDAKARVTQPYVGCYLHVNKRDNRSEIFEMTAAAFADVLGESGSGSS